MVKNFNEWLNESQTKHTTFEDFLIKDYFEGDSAEYAKWVGKNKELFEQAMTEFDKFNTADKTILLNNTYPFIKVQAIVANTIYIKKMLLKIDSDYNQEK